MSEKVVSEKEVSEKVSERVSEKVVGCEEVHPLLPHFFIFYFFFNFLFFFILPHFHSLSFTLTFFQVEALLKSFSGQPHQRPQHSSWAG